MRTGKVQNDLPMLLTISRIHYGGDDDFIEVRITDDTSATEFVTVKVRLADFTNCITGLSRVSCIGEVIGLEVIGKTHEHKKLVFENPENLSRYNEDGREKLTKLAEKECPKGWTPDATFDSQDSFFTKDGKHYAQTTIRRWI